MDLSQFSRLMEKRATVVPKRVAEIKKEVAQLVLQSVVEDTPIDTGKAKSNWQVNLGSPATAAVPAYSPGTHGSTANSNVTATIAAGNLVISGTTPGVDIHITNNLHYIGDLNRGTSTQAPAGFVQAAAIRASNLIKNAKVIVS